MSDDKPSAEAMEEATPLCRDGMVPGYYRGSNWAWVPCAGCPNCDKPSAESMEVARGVMAEALDDAFGEWESEGIGNIQEYSGNIAADTDEHERIVAAAKANAETAFARALDKFREDERGFARIQADAIECISTELAGGLDGDTALKLWRIAGQLKHGVRTPPPEPRSGEPKP